MSTLYAGNTATTTLLQTPDSLGVLTLTASTGVINAAGNTGAWIIPVGTTAERPASPTAGMIRYNTTTSQLEGYFPNVANWLPIP